MQSAEGIYANDFRCFLRLIYRHGIEELEGAGGRLVRVQETYRQAMTGRSQAIGGAFQNMSNEMKIKTLMVDGQKNYDFESSHDRILLEHFEAAGIECPLLGRILDYEGDAKERIAYYAGVSRACVKLVLHPLKMGSTLAETTAYAPFSAVVKDVGEDGTRSVCTS